MRHKKAPGNLEETRGFRLTPLGEKSILTLAEEERTLGNYTKLSLIQATLSFRSSFSRFRANQRQSVSVWFFKHSDQDQDFETEDKANLRWHICLKQGAGAATPKKMFRILEDSEG